MKKLKNSRNKEDPENKKIVGKRKLTKKKLIIIIAVSVFLVVAVAGGLLFYFLKIKKSGVGNGMGAFSGFGKMNSMNTANFNTENMVTASGVVNMGTTEETFDVENLTEGLEIEEIYISSGQEISAGDKVLVLNDDDVASARDELENALESAELAYRSGKIEYEQEKITAEYEYNQTVLDGEQAEEIYNETIASLSDSVDKAQQELDDTNDRIAEYKLYVDDGSYDEYFGVTEYQNEYDENLAILEQKMEEWGVSWSEVTNGSSMGGPGGGSSTADFSTLHGQYVTVLRGLYSVLEQNASDLEEAKEKSEDAKQNASLELQTLELSLPSLKENLTQAKEDYETQSLDAKQTYEKALSNAERAQSDYQTTLDKAEADMDELEDAYEDAKSNLELFEKLVGDGVLYASASGSVLRVMLRTGQDLTSDSTIFVYSNPDEMTITVSVDQTDIAKLYVGETAMVMSSAGNTYNSTIAEINPVTSSDSRTNITYSVTVKITGDADGLESNDSVSVIFGMEATQ